jgi:hypothetical protein
VGFDVTALVEGLFDVTTAPPVRLFGPFVAFLIGYHIARRS